MSHPLHHISLRKRDTNELEPYPHQDPLIRLMDKVILFVGVLSPLMTAPQIYKIFINQNAESVSSISWFSYTIISAIWVVYGLLHKDRAIIISQSVWVLMAGLVWIGAIIY